MKKSEIPGVHIKELNPQYDDRGVLWEILRADDPNYKGFGQVYCSTTLPGVIKGFHEHRAQTDNITCVKGRLKLVLIKQGAKEGGAIPLISLENPAIDVVEEYILVPGGLVVTIPPGIMHGWKNIGTEEAFAINVPNFMYNREDPDEIRYPPHDWYDWETEDR